MDWTTIINQLFEIVLIPLLGTVATFLIFLLKAKKDDLIAKQKDEKAKKYIELLNQTITDCVMATNQTYVEALKAQGSFDAEAQKEAFRLTYEAVRSILSEEAQTYLSEITTDLTAYITTKIEAAVATNKPSAN